jgi:hypothetical protein
MTWKRGVEGDLNDREEGSEWNLDDMEEGVIRPGIGHNFICHSLLPCQVHVVAKLTNLCCSVLHLTVANELFHTFRVVNSIRIRFEHPQNFSKDILDNVSQRHPENL